MSFSYLTRAQARALVAGGVRIDGLSTRTSTELVGDGDGGWHVYFRDGEFSGFLASSRAPSLPKVFATMDAAFKAACEVHDGLFPAGPGLEGWLPEVLIRGRVRSAVVSV